MNLPNLDERPLSYSSLMAFKKSPAHYMHYLTEPPKKTPALIFGGFFHCMILQPEKLDEKYMAAPKIDKRTKQGKLDWEAFLEENGDKVIISQEDWQTGIEMKQAISKNSMATKCIQQVGQTEKKMNFKINDLNMVGYIDGISEDFLFELKTAKDAHPETWPKEAYNYNYHIQAAIYQQAWAQKSGKFLPMRYLIIEKAAPYGISVMNATGDYMDAGKYEVSKLTDEFKYCMDNNMFGNSYDFRAIGDYFPLDLPAWANKD